MRPATKCESLVLEFPRGMRGDVGELKSGMRDLRADMATKEDFHSLRADLGSDLHSLRADVASDRLTMQRDTRDQIVGLRRTVIEYHSAVIGQA